MGQTVYVLVESGGQKEAFLNKSKPKQGNQKEPNQNKPIGNAASENFFRPCESQGNRFSLPLWLGRYPPGQCGDRRRPARVDSPINIDFRGVELSLP